MLFQLICNAQSKSENSKRPELKSLSEINSESYKNNPVDYLKNYNGENNKLFVFVGRLISIDELPHKEFSMDAGFKARYIVLQKVFGNFSHDTIEFVAYDHYGIPFFSRHDNVLLFVSADSGTYYHQKYMYNVVYMTKNGKWAGTYAKDDYNHEYNKETKVKPIKINFANEVSFSDKNSYLNWENVIVDFPEPYFKIVGKKVIAVYGNYVEELFILKRDGYLTTRHIFENGKLIE